MQGLLFAAPAGITGETMADENKLRKIRKRISYKRFSALYDTLIRLGISREQAVGAMTEFYEFCDRNSMFGSKSYASSCKEAIELLFDDKSNEMEGNENAS